MEAEFALQRVLREVNEAAAVLPADAGRPEAPFPATGEAEVAPAPPTNPSPRRPVPLSRERASPARGLESTQAAPQAAPQAEERVGSPGAGVGDLEPANAKAEERE